MLRALISLSGDPKGGDEVSDLFVSTEDGSGGGAVGADLDWLKTEGDVSSKSTANNSGRRWLKGSA
jgi:hypothetical protein